MGLETVPVIKWCGQIRRFCLMAYQPMHGYLIPKPFYKYIYIYIYIRVCVCAYVCVCVCVRVCVIFSEYFLDNFIFKQMNWGLICLHTVKWFQVLLFNINNPNQYLSFVCMHVNGFKYCYLTPILIFDINHFLHEVKWLQVLLLIVCKLLNRLNHCYVTLIIIPNINYLCRCCYAAMCPAGLQDTKSTS